MSTIYYNSRHHNLTIPNGVNLSIGTSGYIYGTAPIAIGGNDTIVNHGVIQGGSGNNYHFSSSSIYAYGKGVKLVNYGTIVGVADDAVIYTPNNIVQIFAAISLQSSTIINKSTITLERRYDLISHSVFYTDWYGIYATNSATITNNGDIVAGRVGIELKANGTINNSGGIFGPNAGVVLAGAAAPYTPPALTNTGTIYSHGIGVKVLNPNTVTNSGTIKGGAIGFEFTHGGDLVNNSGGVIFSYGGPNDGVYAVGGYNTTVVNDGNINSLVNVGNDATISNSGTISGPFAAIHLNTGTTGSGATVTNSGLIGQTGSGAILFNGNGVLNNSSEIIAPAYGVSVARGTVMITNSGEIEGTSGITITAGAVSISNTGGIDSPSSVAISISGGQVNIVNYHRIAGHMGVIAGAKAIVTIANFSTIQGDAGDAVDLLNSSDRFITHPGSDLIGTVKAAGGVLEFAAGAATYMRDTLGGSYTGFGAYRIDAGGSWSMHGTNAIQSGVTFANYGHLNLYGTLSNNGDVFHDGVDVKTYGVFTNGGYVSSDGVAVTLGLYGRLSNTGTVRGTGLTNAQGAVEVTHTSTITNAAGGIIEGYNGVRGLSVTLVNSGLVNGYNSCGVYLTSGGAYEFTVSKITNNAGGTIEGGNYGIYAHSAESVTNAGVISGAVAGVAGPVDLVNSGKISGGRWGVSGHASVTNHGSIYYGVGGGVGAAFVYNAGYLKGGNIIADQYAVELAPGGSLTQVAGGTILAAPGRSIGSSGGAAIRVTGGTLAASIDLAGGVVRGGAGIFGISYAYSSNPPGAGGAGGAGIDFVDTGSLTVAAGVTLAGGAGGYGGTGKSSGGTGGAGGAGVNFDASGSVSNAGLIEGGAGGAAGKNKSGPPGVSGAGGAGLFLGGGGVVTNTGDLQGGAAGSPGARGTSGLGGAGVSVAAGGTVFNFGQISGYDGVRQTGAGALTVVNYGAISGTRDSVLFNRASDRLVLENGSSFAGVAVGGGGTLEITNPGAFLVDVITGLGSVGTLAGESSLAFTGFGAYQVDAGAFVLETGSIGSGQTLINNGTVTTPSPNSVTLSAGGTILNHALISDNPATNYRGGVEADNGGRIVNYAGAVIYAQEGLSGAGFTLVNYGVVVGHNNCSVFIDGPTASVTNTATGTLQGYNYGVVSVQAATVVTAGSISGQIASVEFRDASSLLVVEAGARFTGGAIRGGGGTIVADGGSDTLTGLGGTLGTLSGSASGVLGGFNSYNEAGGTLTLAGVETLAAGKTFTNSGVALVTGTLTNLGAMRGGTGATGATYYGPAGPGKAGSVAATVSGGTLVNNSSVIGGVGGAGGVGVFGVKGFIAYSFPGGAGGAGGAGAAVNAGRLTNTASIIGGVGGAGGRGGAFPTGPAGIASGGAGGVGGAGVSVAGGTATNSGTIQGGGGGAGGYSIIPTCGGAGGAGGAGLLISGGGFTNTGMILGGAGGAGSQLAAAGPAGDGVLAVGGGRLVNGIGGLISGFIGVEDAGAGGLTVANAGSIGGTHDAVLFAADSDRLIVDAGAKFTGAAVGGGGTVEFNEGGGTLSLAGGTGAMAGAASLGFGGFGLYQLDKGLWTLSASGALLSGQTLRLANAATALVQGEVSNAGSIAVAATSSLTELRVLAGGATFSGGGTVSLGGKNARIIGATTTATLTNLDTITGAGNIGNKTLVLINEAGGVIDATGALNVATSGASLSNAGLMEAASGGLLTLDTPVIDQSGGGTILAAGGRVDIESADIIGGAVASTGIGYVRVFSGNCMLDGTTSPVALTGHLQVVTNTTLTVAGAIANSNQIDLLGGHILIAAAGASLTGKGSVILSNSSANLITGATTTATLTNIDNHIRGSGALGGGSMILINEAAGVISNPDATLLTIDTGISTITNAGTIAATALGGGVDVKSAVANSGLLIAQSRGTLKLEGTVTGAGSGRILSSGRLIVTQAFAETVTFADGTG
ncbi:MAG TPA: hypothetical protein VGH15_13005, partial [Caulobacteraceae bacterium]